MIPPTVFLPSLKTLKTCSESDISTALASLRYIYLPEVRGSSRRIGCSSTAELKQTVHDLAALRADTFERAFSIQWLTRFVAVYSDVRDHGEILEEAAALLAICAGAAASGAVTRTFKFVFDEGWRSSLGDTHIARPDNSDGAPNEITVIVRDAPLESSDFSSVGVQTWGGSCILAEMIAASPRQFSIFPREDHHARTPFRALELGAGTGLASLVLGKVLMCLRGGTPITRDDTYYTHMPPTDDDLVLATDMYPAALANLRLNLTVNFPHRPRSQNTVPHTDDMGVRTLLPGQQHQVSEQHISTASQSPPGPRMEILPLDWCAVHQFMLTSALERPIASSARISVPESVRGYRDEEEAAHVGASVKPILGTTLDVLSITISPRETCANVHNDADTPADVKLRGSSPSPMDPIGGTGWVSLLQKESFDLIMGADIVYEREHAVWVKSCVEQFLRRPNGRGDVGGRFHLVVPLRGTHVGEVGCVEDVWRRREGRGHALVILSEEDIVCDAYRDRGDGEEVVYRYYKIGWVWE